MTSTQGNIIIAALLVMVIGGLYAYIQDANAKAIASGDYSQCWTDECKTAVSYKHYI